MNESVHDIIKRCDEMRKTGYEIPKIAFMPKSLDDVKNLFYETRDFTKYEHILCAMGPMGIASRILAYRTHSFLTYTSVPSNDFELRSIGHIDPIMMNQVYHFKDLNEKTSIFGITGWPLLKTDSPFLHNQGYVNHFMNSVYIPIPSEDIHQAIEFANEIGARGLSVTVPHKETVLRELYETDDKVKEISASNTIVKKNDKWCGYNTDCTGFSKALLEFTGLKNLRHKRVSIIGAGGASRAIAYAVKMLGGKACVFNRTPMRAKSVADMFGFEYAMLSVDAIPLIEKYSDIVIQTTSVGMNSTEPSNSQNNPLYFYRRTGNEILFDIIYTPKVTPIMERAMAAGCKVCNGETMLKYQGYEQFKIFTGVDYEETKSE
jgi:3-dehydroquinate dehydratase/shikimate dehydrogenase